MKFRAAIIITGCLMLVQAPAAGLAQSNTCRAPEPPRGRPNVPREPRAPTCNESNCSEYDIERCNDEVERYNSSLQSFQNRVRIYNEELNEYVRLAQAYAICELENIQRQLR